MEIRKEKWDINSHRKQNFKWTLSNEGWWRLEEPMVQGKWLFLVEPIGSKTAPTFGDQRNFFTGLFEAEWRNDNFVFNSNKPRNPQREIKVEMFKEIINKISERADIKDTPRGIKFYIDESKKQDERNTN